MHYRNGFIFILILKACIAELISPFPFPMQHSFFKQFYGSVSKTDYTTMRLGFIMVSIACNKLALSAFLVCENEFHFWIADPLPWKLEIRFT